MASTPSGQEPRSSRPLWLGKDERKWDHVRIHIQLLHDKRLGAIDLAVYMGLVAHADLYDGRCFPAAGTLARYINSSEKTVRRSIKLLQEAGYIQYEQELGRANTYFVCMPPTLDTTTDLAGDPGHHDRPPGHHDRGRVDTTTDHPGHHDRRTRTSNKNQKTTTNNKSDLHWKFDDVGTAHECYCEVADCG